jgi:diguanylate cyclase (GGDEF)-like protein
MYNIDSTEGAFVLSYDIRKKSVVMNPHFLSFLGYENADESYIDIDNLLFEEDKESFINALVDRPTLSEAPYIGDYRFVHRNGYDIWLRVHRLTQEISDGELTTSTAYLSEISDTRINELIRDNIIDGTYCVSFLVDLKRDEMLFSHNVQELLPGARLRYGAQFMETIAQYILDDDLPNVLEPIGEVLSGDRELYACEFRIRRNNDVLWLALRAKLCADPVSKDRLLVGTLTNLDDMRQYRSFAEASINRHKVTLLPSRTALLEATEKVLCDRNVFSAAIILADILAFQPLNDRFGREGGNQVLKAFADHLMTILPSGADLFHMTGDTFAILWPHASRIQIDRFMHYTIMAGPLSVLIGSDTLDITYSMSGTVYPSCGSTAVELVENAEITLHKIKKSRKSEYALYSPKDKLEITEKLDFELQVTRSLRNTNENFLLFFQPLFSPYDGRLLGSEALLRWISPNNEVLGPERVIDGLTQTGNIEYVSAWVLDKGIKQCQIWIESGAPSDFQMHINITADDLMRSNFANEVMGYINKYGLDPSNLMLEITESSLMKNISICRKNVTSLRAQGVRFSLDDFGSGYSSLSYLKELPVDEVKIDRAFIENVQKDKFNHSFVSTIVMLVHSIHTKVCIEGVESKEQAEAVRKLNPDLFQGFYFGRPVPPDDFEKQYLIS